MIDTVYYDTVPVEDFKAYLRSKYEAYMNLMEKQHKGKPPTYSYEVAKQKLIQSREGNLLTDAAATALLKRALTPVGRLDFCFITLYND